MTIVDTEIAAYLTYSSSKFKSLGGNITNAALTQTTDESEWDEYRHNLFDRIKPDDIDNARPTYRCLAIKNNHSTDTWSDVRAWIVSSAEVQSEVSIALLKEVPAGSPGYVQQIPSEYEAPTGTFNTTATTKSAGEDCGDITADGWIGIWIRRSPTADVKARSFEHLWLRVEGDDASGNGTEVGIDIHLLWDTITGEVEECLQRLNDIPRERVNLRGAQEYHDDSEYLVNQLSSSEAIAADLNRVIMARTVYLIYQEYTVEIERAGGGIPPMVVSRVYELRRVSNEMFNSISKTPQRMKTQIIKSRSERARLTNY